MCTGGYDLDYTDGHSLKAVPVAFIKALPRRGADPRGVDEVLSPHNQRNDMEVD